MCEDVIADDQVSGATFLQQAPGGGRTEEAHIRVYAALDRRGRDVGSGFHSQHRNAMGEEELQQVAVVAGDLDYS